MKKILLSFAALTFIAITSCSSDDNNSEPSADILVKRMVYEQEDPDGFNYDITYTYNGKKILAGNYTDGTIEKYYYSGDLITKIEYIFGGEVEEQELFLYNANGKLIEYRYQDIVDDFEDKSLFTYPNENTIIKTNITGVINNTVTTGNVSTITLTNGEVSKIQSGGKIYNYTYDNKNSPFRNVTGYAEIAYAFAGDFELEGRGRNILSIKNETDNINYTTNTIQYNANDYPTLTTSVAIFNDFAPNFIEELIVRYYYE